MDTNFAPKQNWQKYDALVAAHGLNRADVLSPTEKFKNYAALFNLIHSARPNRSFDDPLEIQRWEEKIQLRNRWVRAARKLDE